MSVDIDPATGAPIVKDETSSFTPSNDAPTTEGNSTQASEEVNQTQQESIAGKPMEVEMLPPPVMPEHLKTKLALRNAILEITSRHCSDSVSRVKCADEIAALLPDW